MSPDSWITLLACFGELLLLVLVVLRGTRSPLFGPLVALSVIVFAWNFCGLAWQVNGREEWRWLEIGFSPWTSSLALYLVMAFTGRRRQLRRVLAAACVFSAAMALVGPAALVSERVRHAYVSGPLPLVHLAGLAPIMALAIGLLVVHLRQSQDPLERASTILLLTALATATAFGSTELFHDLGANVPRLGALGILLGNSLVVLVTLRLHLFDRALTTWDLVWAVLLAVVGVCAYLVVLDLLGTQAALLVVASVTVTLLLLSGLRRLSLGMRAERMQLEQLAYLGRLSSQLAHDLKNPLAALRGAAQYLEVELAHGRPLDAQREFLTLIVEQADRMQRVVNDYHRLGRMQTSPKPVDPNALVKEVLALQAFAAGASVRIDSALDVTVPPCPLDRDLICTALENLLRNAFQAMPDGGTVRVTTRTSHSGDRAYLVLGVTDTGVGMDARTKERAFEDFFTTRSEGTGLGLGFVRRVAGAHGGRVVLESREKQGTTIELWLPLSAPMAQAG